MNKKIVVTALFMMVCNGLKAHDHEALPESLNPSIKRSLEMQEMQDKSLMRRQLAALYVQGKRDEAEFAIQLRKKPTFLRNREFNK